MRGLVEVNFMDLEGSEAELVGGGGGGVQCGEQALDGPGPSCTPDLLSSPAQPDQGCPKRGTRTCGQVPGGRRVLWDRLLPDRPWVRQEVPGTPALKAWELREHRVALAPSKQGRTPRVQAPWGGH